MELVSHKPSLYSSNYRGHSCDRKFGHMLIYSCGAAYGSWCGAKMAKALPQSWDLQSRHCHFAAWRLEPNAVISPAMFSTLSAKYANHSSGGNCGFREINGLNRNFLDGRFCSPKKGLQIIVYNLKSLNNPCNYVYLITGKKN